MNTNTQHGTARMHAPIALIVPPIVALILSLSILVTIALTPPTVEPGQYWKLNPVIKTQVQR